jgi:hypothetical protein
VSTTSPDPLIESYLKQLRMSARPLPRAPRDELVEQIREHLREALPPGHSQAEARRAIEKLGDPDTIVAEEFDRLGLETARAGKLEWAVVFLLPFGSFVLPLIGWILGIILLWASRVWSTREKLVGTLVPPGGLSAILWLALIGTGTTCTGGGGAGRPTIEHCTAPAIPAAIGTPLAILFVIAGIVTPIHLARRALASRS